MRVSPVAGVGIGGIGVMGTLVVGTSEVPPVAVAIAGTALALSYLHANNKNNPNRHIVYQIYGYQNGIKRTIKYGISDYEKYRESRPKSQLNGLQIKLASRGFSGISYGIMGYTNGRIQALLWELEYVNQYRAIYGEMPVEQLRPLPWRMNPLTPPLLLPIDPFEP